MHAAPEHGTLPWCRGTKDTIVAKGTEALVSKAHRHGAAERRLLLSLLPPRRLALGNCQLDLRPAHLLHRNTSCVDARREVQGYIHGPKRMVVAELIHDLLYRPEDLGASPQVLGVELELAPHRALQVRAVLFGAQALPLDPNACALVIKLEAHLLRRNALWKDQAHVVGRVTLVTFHAGLELRGLEGFDGPLDGLGDVVFPVLASVLGAASLRRLGWLDLALGLRLWVRPGLGLGMGLWLRPGLWPGLGRLLLLRRVSLRLFRRSRSG